MQWRRPAEVPARQAWERAARGEVRLLDLRTGLERRRYGAPPGSTPVPLLRHVLWPHRDDAIYLCQHAVRSKLTGWRGAGEVAGGWVAWKQQNLPAES